MAGALPLLVGGAGIAANQYQGYQKKQGLLGQQNDLALLAGPKAAPSLENQIFGGMGSSVPVADLLKNPATASEVSPAALSELNKFKLETKLFPDMVTKRYWDSQTPSTVAPMILGEGATAIDPRTGSTIASNPRPEKPADWKDPAYLEYLRKKADAERAPIAPKTPVQQFQERFGPLGAEMTPELDANGNITGRQVPMKGGTKDIETQRPAAEASLDAFKAQADVTYNLADKLSKNSNLPGALGPVNSRLPTVSSKTADVEADIKALKSQLSLQKVAELKQAGVSSGNVTESEWPKFEAAIASLESTQSYPKYMQNLAIIKDFIKRATQRTQKSFDAKFGNGGGEWSAVQVNN